MGTEKREFTQEGRKCVERGSQPNPKDANRAARPLFPLSPFQVPICRFRICGFDVLVERDQDRNSLERAHITNQESTQ